MKGKQRYDNLMHTEKTSRKYRPTQTLGAFYA